MFFPLSVSVGGPWVSPWRWMFIDCYFVFIDVLSDSYYYVLSLFSCVRTLKASLSDEQLALRALHARLSAQAQ